MSTALALRTGDMIHTFDDLMKFAGLLLKSQMLPQSIKTSEAAAAIILKGRELGMPMMESFSQINIIAGKPTLSPQGMIALAQRSGLLEDLQINGDDKQCTVTVKRKGRSPHTATFTWADASKMMTQEKGETIALTAKYNWRQMPATMLQWRCVAKNFRVSFADIMGGMYPPEELGADVNEDGEIIDSTAVAPEPEQPSEPTPAPVNVPPLPEAVHVPSKTNGGNGHASDALQELENLVAKHAQSAGRVKEIPEAAMNRYRQEAMVALSKTPLGNDDELRHAFIKQQWGKAGLTACNVQELMAIRDWAGRIDAKAYLALFVAQHQTAFAEPGALQTA